MNFTQSINKQIIIMDILNFISWTKGGRVVTSVDASHTLLPVGLKDPKRDDGYLAGAISVLDFASAITPTFTNGNIKFGESALASVTTGSDNIALGDNSLETITTASVNIAIGKNALKNTTTSDQSIAIGSDALYDNTSGSQNIALGNSALLRNTTGNNNVGLGTVTMLFNTTGYQNIAIGTQSLFYNTTGRDNIAIGVSTGNANTTGQFNIMIGSDIDNQNFSNCIILGKQAQATASNQFVVGSAGSNAGSVTLEANTSTQVWNVRINGIARKILLA
jgi:hypothetical protein